MSTEIIRTICITKDGKLFRSLFVLSQWRKQINNCLKNYNYNPLFKAKINVEYTFRRRTIFYIGTLLILITCVCVCVCARTRACVLVCVCVFGCCFVGANGLLVDVCQCCCLVMFGCLPLSRHFPCCKIWWIKNLNLNLNCEIQATLRPRVRKIYCQITGQWMK